MSPAEPQFDQAAAHRWFAIEWNNAAWDALETSRTAHVETTQETQQTQETQGDSGEVALHLAHASLAHWLEAGNELNHIRALCVVANAESVFGAAASAVKFADRALALAQGEQGEVEGLADWDQAFLLDARMRAVRSALKEEQGRDKPDPQRVASLEADAAKCEQQAEASGQAISDDGDRKFFLEWFAKR